MLEEDIEATHPLISPDIKKTENTITHRIINANKDGNCGYFDWIIGIILVACIVATIVIIVCQQ